MTNNAWASLNPPEDTQPEVVDKLREEENRLIQIIESISTIRETNAWSSLKEAIFDKAVSRILGDLQDEARKSNPSTNRLNRLTGELEWAERYADFTKLENNYRMRLQAIRKQLHGKSE